MKTAIVINNSFDGIETITLVGNENPKGYDWWMYGGIRQPMQSVEAAKQWATATGNRFSGCFSIDPWGQWVSV